MGRKPKTGEKELSWYEASQLGRIYVSSEVIMYSIKDVAEMTGWSHNTNNILPAETMIPLFETQMPLILTKYL